VRALAHAADPEVTETTSSDTGAVDEVESTITPVLTVRHATEAVEFYQRAFGAQEIDRNTYPDGRIVAEMAVGRARFRVADEAPEAGNLSPQTLGGTTVRINLLVADPDAVARQAIANGAIEVAPIADQSYGLRQGRLAAPLRSSLAHWTTTQGQGRRLGKTLQAGVTTIASRCPKVSTAMCVRSLRPRRPLRWQGGRRSNRMMGTTCP
jgi:PhnB protein